MKKIEKQPDSVIGEHGSVRSYAAGFVLSLALTLVPYFLVTRQVIEGSGLLLTILGLGILQMIVQIVFFLHLGRGPKPLYNVVFFFATGALIILVVGASLLIMNNLYRNMSPEEVTTRLAQDENIAQLDGKPTGACQGNGKNYTVVIKDNQMLPSHTSAKQCDTLTLSDEDGIDREFVFGLHENHSSYGGMYEVGVRGDRYKVITLNETGDFFIHDHDNPTTMTHFTVEP